jgi:hypothetical protein
MITILYFQSVGDTKWPWTVANTLRVKLRTRPIGFNYNYRLICTHYNGSTENCLNSRHHKDRLTLISVNSARVVNPKWTIWQIMACSVYHHQSHRQHRSTLLIFWHPAASVCIWCVTNTWKSHTFIHRHATSKPYRRTKMEGKLDGTRRRGRSKQLLETFKGRTPRNFKRVGGDGPEEVYNLHWILKSTLENLRHKCNYEFHDALTRLIQVTKV